MKKIKWDEEEAVALFDLYFRYGGTYAVPECEIDKLTLIYNKRATTLNLQQDEKFRNPTGLKMQLACIHYVVTNGKEGLSGASKLFYNVFDLYKTNIIKFNIILNGFYQKYT